MRDRAINIEQKFLNKNNTDNKGKERGEKKRIVKEKKRGER